MLQALIPIAVSLIGGAIGKHSGKKIEAFTQVPVQNALGPIFAAIGAGAATLPETPAAALAEGGPAFAWATLIYVMIKNIKELIMVFNKRK